MFINVDKPLPFIKEYIEALNMAIEEHKPGHHLSISQKIWLGFCLMAILVTNSVCWAKFSRASLGKYSESALSWMFLKSLIPWDFILHISVMLILEEYGITEGVLVADDSDKERSKSVKRIHKAHKYKDKKSGGYVIGQEFIMLLLVTPFVPIPVGFAFYMPDPVLSAWRKQDEKLKKAGVAKKDRPPEPKRNPSYPTKAELVLTLLKQFLKYHGDIKIKAILVDALYGNADFMDKASVIFDKINGIQVISQLHNDQNIRHRGKNWRLSDYFRANPGISRKISIRGSDKKFTVIVSAARLYVNSHKKKRFVIAIKYEDEAEYRYIVASDMSWHHMDIVQTYTLRWLVEVFFEDWKSHEGWGRLAKQPGKEGSSRGLTLSLLLDHCLLLHPEQKVRLKNKQPAGTVGSLRERIQVEAWLTFVRDLLSVENPAKKLEQLSKALENALENIFPVTPSKKHMNNRDTGKHEPSPSLKHRAQCAQRAEAYA